MLVNITNEAIEKAPPGQVGNRRAFGRHKASIVKVGDGRGFVVTHGGEKLIVTAAHCLPHLPPAHVWFYLEERTYADLAGRLGGTGKVWMECIFADPVSDIALLGSPDNQALYDEA
jgi:hypothetical protein